MVETGQFVQGDGVRLWTREWVAGDRARDRPILLIHGLASTSHIFDLLAPLLSPGERRVVAYDQRGHGESTKPSRRYGFAYTAGDAAAVIQVLGLRRPVLVGHSWGANVALETAVRHRDLVSGVFLLDGGFLAMRRRMDWPTAKQMLAPPEFAGMPLERWLAMVRAITADQFPAPEAAEAVFRSLVRVDSRGRVHPRLSRANHLQILRAMWLQDPVELLRGVRVPTLVVAMRQRSPSEQDAAFLEAKRAGMAVVRKIDANVRAEWMEGIHDVPLQRPKALASRILRFVETSSRSLR